MNILIIDDDNLIGELLVYWLETEQFSRYSINVIYTDHCKKALDIAKNEKIDIVLMDVNLPDINGIEGTQYFKKEFPNSLIIAISSDTSENTQLQMLKSGAYDYITKPLVEDIFIKRIKTYIRVLEYRSQKKSSSAKSSLFNDDIFNYSINFPIKDEDNLIEFWDLMLSRFHKYHEVPKMHDTIVQIYNFGSLLLEKENEFSLKLEESEEYIYLTILAEKNILLKKGIFLEDNYMFDNKKNISLRLSNNKTVETQGLEESVVQEIIVKSEEIKIFDIFDVEDMEDLDDILYKIFTAMQSLKDNYNLSDIESLCISLEKFSFILARYSEFNHFYESIVEFISVLKLDMTEYSTWNDIYVMLNSFIEDIVLWHKKLFFEGAPSVDFMDESFSANVSLIKNMIKPDNQDTSVDDIFDF